MEHCSPAAKLRNLSRLFREASRKHADRAMKRLFAQEALNLAQQAEAEERREQREPDKQD